MVIRYSCLTREPLTIRSSEPYEVDLEANKFLECSEYDLGGLTSKILELVGLKGIPKVGSAGELAEKREVRP
jgi:hypothetical protein